jgi:hypothetical protein
MTHYAHGPIELEGGTTFHFVDSFDGALAEATEAAGDRPIDVAGGASAVRQASQAGASTNSCSTRAGRAEER